jgi:glycosyltransferase involved in cell wall biosynthesis
MTTSVTVVSVVRNDEKNIEKTIMSVLSQNYPALEYIVIDGGSTDATQNLIQKYASRIKLIISEPDQNIFDAMNKGIQHATGDWINFMNSGDRFVSNSSVSDAITTERSTADIIYGDSIIESENGKTRLLKVNNKKAFWKRYINHQSIFTKTQLLKDNPFNIRYDICSDFDFLIRMHVHGCKIQTLNFPVSIRKSGGKSDKNRIKSHLQKSEILKNLNAGSIRPIAVKMMLIYNIGLEMAKTILKRLLGKLS